MELRGPAKFDFFSFQPKNCPAPQSEEGENKIWGVKNYFFLVGRKKNQLGITWLICGILKCLRPFSESSKLQLSDEHVRNACGTLFFEKVVF